MPELARITLPSGTTYDFKDATARAAIAGGTTFLGITTTALTDGATTSSILINGETVSAVNGGIAIYNNKEFIFSSADSKWHEIGDTTDLRALAFKDSASGSYQPEGSISKPTFTGSETTSTGTFTPAGSVSAPTITVTPNTTSKFVASSATGGGSVTAGSAAACTLPALTTSVVNETLVLGWSAGSFTPNAPTEVTLPTFSSQTIATGIESATATQPTFTGEEGNVSVSGTPSGDVSQPTFTGTSKPVTVS